MNEKKEISFFKKLIMSIKDFEKYPELASKKMGTVLAYFFKLLAIFVIIVTFSICYKTAVKMKNVLEYVENTIPDFTFENNKLTMKTDDTIIIDNRDNLIDRVIIDTSNLEQENYEKHKEALQKANNGIALLQDKVLIKTQVTNGVVEYSYSDIKETYGIGNFNKEQLLTYFSGNNLVFILIGIFIMIFIYMFILYTISMFLDIILLAIFGYITALFVHLRLRFIAMCKIAMYSLTLPIILNAIAILIETFTGFTIQYLEFMYMGVAYIYIITAILMIKSDVMKNQQELARIIEEQTKVREELERKKEEEEREKQKEREREKQRKKEKKEEKDKEEGLGEEPQGENA